MNDMEILRLADRCGVTAVSKHEWDGEKFNHTDDVLDGDFAGLIQFARLLIADEREACADVAGIALLGCERSIRDRVVRAIKARGEK